MSNITINMINMLNSYNTNLTLPKQIFVTQLQLKINVLLYYAFFLTNPASCGVD